MRRTIFFGNKGKGKAKATLQDVSSEEGVEGEAEDAEQGVEVRMKMKLLLAVLSIYKRRHTLLNR